MTAVDQTVIAKAFAPAKINLTLHVIGRRADGYHLLDSLVVFADFGDWITLRQRDGLHLHVTGPMAAGVPTGADNLVLRAARAAGADGLAITLEKHLPAAAGIGGGTSDAAALLRALVGWPGLVPFDPLSLGADMPVCQLTLSARMSGIGEQVAPEPRIPLLPAVLVNPRVPVSTPTVFRGLRGVDGAPMDPLPGTDTPAGWADWLAGQRNDLEAPARELVPEIDAALEAIGETGAMLARMSGSGATCFGLFPTRESAGAAARLLAERFPQWWVRAVTLGGRQDQVSRDTT